MNDYRELKLLLDMYKGVGKEQRDKVQLMAAEKKARQEVEELKAQVRNAVFKVPPPFTLFSFLVLYFLFFVQSCMSYQQTFTYFLLFKLLAILLLS